MEITESESESGDYDDDKLTEDRNQFANNSTAMVKLLVQKLIIQNVVMMNSHIYSFGINYVMVLHNLNNWINFAWSIIDLMEAILESTPQALLQLGFLLKSSQFISALGGGEIEAFDILIILSFTSSLLSIAFSMVRDDEAHFELDTWPFLMICVTFKYLSKGLLLWNDISNRIRNTQNTETILFPLLFKCCVNNSNGMNINKCIQILKWMKDYNYTIKNSDKSQYFKDIVTLITKCDDKLHKLVEIHSLIDDNNLYVKTLLINKFGKCTNGLQYSINIFASIDDMNSVAINAMMTIYLHHNVNKNVLQLYNKYESFHDNISHLDIC